MMKVDGGEVVVNERLLSIRYAVRGPLAERAARIERELQEGAEKPFDRVIRANCGDCHALGQKPITFLRQVLALAACPSLMTSPDIPEDVKDRVRELLADCTKGSVGAYSPPSGLAVVRRHAAAWLAVRDAVPAAPDDLFLGAGASELIKTALSLFVSNQDGQPTGVMVPSPQYPVFSGTLAELGLARVDYFLDEARGWAVSPAELRRARAAAPAPSRVVVLVVINPGNPTGQVLSRENIEQIIRFAEEHRLVILADEVYQENIVSKPFHSFKKVSSELGSSVCVLSCVTVSKGWAAECGLRGALLEAVRAPPAAARALRLVRALAQCPALPGQLALDCVVKPPAPGSPSYPQFARELADIRRALAERAREAAAAFNAMPACSCSEIEGSMFAFPRVLLPPRAQLAARAAGLLPDEFYCLRLLEETGVCVVPGSGFGQLPGTFHFRTTILHPPHEFSYMLSAIGDFHRNFLQTYAD